MTPANPSASNSPEMAALDGSERLVHLAEILLDRGTQSRLGGNDDSTVKRYAEEMAAGLWDFERRPLPVLFFDGDCYYPGDGHHRITAARRCSLTELRCEVRLGGQREALFYSNTEANKFHGKQLTRKDKRNRVRNLLLDGEWALMSDREIARHCGVSAPFVGNVRREMTDENRIAASSQRMGRDGKIRNVTNIGRTGADRTSTDRTGADRTSVDKRPVTAPESLSDELAGGRGGTHAPKANNVVEATLYDALQQERDELQHRLAEQQRRHRLEVAQVTQASQADELRQALADDEALMQQIYDGLGTIEGALEPVVAGEGDLEVLQVAALQAVKGIGLMRRILQAKAPNLIVEDEEADWEE